VRFGAPAEYGARAPGSPGPFVTGGRALQINSGVTFYQAAVYVVALLVVGWVVVAVVNKIGEVAIRRSEAKAKNEQEYLRQMLREIEEIKRRLGADD